VSDRKLPETPSEQAERELREHEADRDSLIDRFGHVHWENFDRLFAEREPRPERKPAEPETPKPREITNCRRCDGYGIETVGKPSEETRESFLKYIDGLIPYEEHVEASTIKRTCQTCGGRGWVTFVRRGMRRRETVDMNDYIVELEPGVWIADGDGDPPRTLARANAKRFESKWLAQEALRVARRRRPFLGASVYSASVKILVGE
jgi:hypothetical protein